jgi:hypothetical protein
MSLSTISTFRSSRKLLALRHVVQVGFQKKVGFAMGAIVDRGSASNFQPPTPNFQGAPFERVE